MSSAEELAAEYERGDLEVGKGSAKRSKVGYFAEIRFQIQEQLLHNFSESSNKNL